MRRLYRRGDHREALKRRCLGNPDLFVWLVLDRFELTARMRFTLDQRFFARFFIERVVTSFVSLLYARIISSLLLRSRDDYLAPYESSFAREPNTKIARMGAPEAVSGC